MWLIILILSKSSLSKELNFDVDGTGFIFSIAKGISVEKRLPMQFAVATLLVTLPSAVAVQRLSLSREDRAAKSALVYSNGTGVNLRFLSFLWRICTQYV